MNEMFIYIYLKKIMIEESNELDPSSYEELIKRSDRLVDSSHRKINDFSTQE